MDTIAVAFMRIYVYMDQGPRWLPLCALVGFGAGYSGFESVANVFMFALVGLLGLRIFFELSFAAAKRGMPLPAPAHDSAFRFIGQPPFWYTENGTRIMTPGEIQVAMQKKHGARAR